MAKSGYLPFHVIGDGRVRGLTVGCYGEYAIGGLTKDHGAVIDARQHVLIDQATGWLAGHLDCGIGEAAEHLASLARDTGTSVAEAAALLALTSYLFLAHARIRHWPRSLPSH